MIRRLKILNEIKNSLNLNKTRIKIKKNYYSIDIIKFLKKKNIIKNSWVLKNFIYVNSYQKKKLKINFLKKTLNKKKFINEVSGSSSIFIKNNYSVIARIDF